MNVPFRIKICGITNSADALAAAAAGADALGLNFYERSVRCISPPSAAEIAGAVRTQFPLVKLVGVFVNATVDQVASIAAAVPLDAVQLHGDETSETLAQIRRRIDSQWLMRAFRCRGTKLEEVTTYLHDCGAQLPDAVLLDAFDPGAYGGTGKRLDWELVRAERAAVLGLPLVLAGGLTAENVAAAIEAARPDAVDVAGGVESGPGIKNADLLRRFISAARAAFEGLGSH